MGVPVVVERTSNIEDFIKDGADGFFIDSENEVNKIVDILSMSNDEICKMKKCCLDNKVFDFRKYVLQFKNILN